MLIITRHKGQRIVIGNDIEIIVTEISRSGIKLGVVAPTALTILRGEVRDAVEHANRAAALSQIADPESLLGSTEPAKPIVDVRAAAQSTPINEAVSGAAKS